MEKIEILEDELVLENEVLETKEIKKSFFRKVKNKFNEVWTWVTKDEKKLKINDAQNFWLLILMIIVSLGYPLNFEFMPPFVTMIIYLPGLIISTFFIKDMKYYFAASLVTFFRGLVFALLAEGSVNGFLMFLVKIQSFLIPILAILSVVASVYNYTTLRKKITSTEKELDKLNKDVV